MADTRAMVSPATDSGHASFGRDELRDPWSGRATDVGRPHPLGFRLVKRLVGTAIGLGVVAVLLCIPALFYGSGSVEPSYEDTTITNYVADFTVADDGDLEVTETLTVDFPVYGKHGIFRFWDKIDDNNPHARLVPEDIKVTRDGIAEPFELSDEDHGRFRVAKIGSASSTLDLGEHTYVLTYSIDGVLAENESSITDSNVDTMFYWQLVPRGWQQSIDQATLTVHLPEPAAGRGPVRDRRRRGQRLHGPGRRHPGPHHRDRPDRPAHAGHHRDRPRHGHP